MANVKKRSEVVAALLANKEALAEAATQERTSIADSSEVMEVFNLNDGDRVTIRATLSSCQIKTHKDGDKKGLPYANFLFSPTGEPGKGMLLCNMVPFYDRTSFQITAGALGWVFQEFAACGFDTKSWADDPGLMEDAAKELDLEKPQVMLTLRCSKGKKKDALYVNMGISRVLDAQQVSSQEEVEADPVPEQLEEALKEKEAPVPVAKSEAKVSRSKATKQPAYKVGDAILFNFYEEEGSPAEEVKGTILAVEEGVFKVTDDKFDYDVIPADIIKLL